MSTTVRKPENSGSNFDPIPQGMHHAICYSVVDLGLQKISSPKYDEKIKPRILLTFEVPDERISYEKDGEQLEGPRVIGKQYTASLHENAILRQDLESWRGKKFTDAELNGFDMSKLIGVNALINVQHNTSNEKTYANIATINPLAKGMETKAAENPHVHYEIEMQYSFPESMPEWIVDKIKNSVQFTFEDDKNLNEQADSHVEEQDDSSDLPF